MAGRLAAEWPHERRILVGLATVLALAGWALAPIGCAASTGGGGANPETGGHSDGGDAAEGDTADPDAGGAGDTGQTDVAQVDSQEPTDTPGAETLPADLADLAIIGARLPAGEPVTILVRDGRISEVRPGGKPATATATATLDGAGLWVAPAFIDSHVHIVFYPVAAELLANGVAGIVDHAAPVSVFAEDLGALRLKAAGPMVTAVKGYPTQSWGSNGYGVECADAAEAVAAVRSLHAQGAALIKVPMGLAPELPDDAIAAVVAEAHRLGLLVSTHALSDAAARRAADLGVDILSHTPTQAMSPDTVAAWSGRTVVSTLRAFGGSPTTVANLKALKAAGARVLYGTDLGNTRDARVDAAELALLVEAGLSGAEILEAGTAAAAATWGFADLGAIAPGKAASLVLLAKDPTVEPLTLATPVQVVIDGAVMTAGRTKSRR